MYENYVNYLNLIVYQFKFDVQYFTSVNTKVI